ncbi:MAG: phosphatidylglycerophosphatase A [Candidatus Dasytiphilus stammeri]
MKFYIKRHIKLSYLLATGFGIGFIKWFPGTLGSILIIPLWWIISLFSWYIYFLTILVGWIYGIYICNVTEQHLGLQHDHSSIVWDEFIGIGITFISLTNYKWQFLIIGFLIFRFFDILKPWPISWVNNHIYGGLGVMLDDLIAGLISTLCLYKICHFFSN